MDARCSIRTRIVVIVAVAIVAIVVDNIPLRYFNEHSFMTLLYFVVIGGVALFEFVDSIYTNFFLTE